MSVRSAAIAAIFLIAVSADAAPVQRTCDGSALTDCELLGKAGLDGSHEKSLALPVQRGGGIVFNSAAYFRALNTGNLKLTQDLETQLGQIAAPAAPLREQKALAGVEKVRAYATAVVANNVAKENWTTEQRALVDRLQTIEVKILSNANSVCSQEVPLGFPNAFYAFDTHTLNLCPALINMTEVQIEQTIAHEMGHVIEPCTASKTLFKVDKDQAFKGPLAECDQHFFYDEDGNPLEVIDGFIGALISEKPAHMAGDPDREPYKTLASPSCRALTLVAHSATTAPAFFKATMNCVSQNFVKANDAEKLKLEAQTLSVANHISVAAAQTKLREKNPPICNSLYREQFADSFAAKVIGQIADEEHWKADDFKVAFLEFQGYACAEAKAGHGFDDRYPPYSYRLAAVLNNPVMQKSLNCAAPLPKPPLCPLQISSEGAAASARRVRAPAKKSSSAK